MATVADENVLRHVAEQRFRRLDAPELLLEVADGTVYVDGRRVKQEREVEKKKAAA